MSNLVSVIIPTYNRAGRVLDAIDSVRRQSYQQKEIVVVDDGSTDETGERLAVPDDVRYIFQERQGPAAARTRGLTMARGEFIASLDSDDVWHSDFLERSVVPLTRFELDFVFANGLRDTGEPSYLDGWQARGRLERFYGDRQGEWALLSPSQVRKMMLDSCPAPSSSLVMRRSSMPPGWNSQMRIADDWYLLLEMILAKPCRAAFTMTPLWLKRIDGTNRYDGRPLSYAVRQLYLHDHSVFRRDFRHRLTREERARWVLPQLKYRAALAYLRLSGREDRSSGSGRRPRSPSPRPAPGRRP